MPMLSALIAKIATVLFGFLASIVGAAWAVRIAAAMALAGIYISCVTYYSSMIIPWLTTLFNTAYGALLGLLFPPIAGSVMAGLLGGWVCIMGKRYIATLTKLAVG